MPFAIASDGVQLYYEVNGRGSVGLLLLHGMGNSDTWRLLLQHLDLNLFRVVTCDWRGHGQSGGDGERFTYPQLNADLLAILEASGIGTAYVGGFSGGCKNAAWIAADQPQRVRGVILIAPCGMDVVPLPRELMQYFSRFVEENKTTPPEFEPWLQHLNADERSAVIRSLASIPRPVLDASVELWIYTTVARHVAGIAQPVLIVAAREDAIYGAEFQRGTTLVTLPTAEMTVLNCGHFIPQEQPAALARLIEQFCSAAS